MATHCAILGAARAAITSKQCFFPTCYGSEFISRDLDLWAYANDVILDFSRPGKPTDNGFILRRGKQSPGLFADPSSRSTASSGQNV